MENLTPEVRVLDSHVANLTFLEQPLLYRWSPQPDITPFELAQSLPHLLYGRGMTRSERDGLPPGVARHFRFVD